MEGIILFIPAMIFIIVFKFYPLIKGFYLSLYKFSGILDSRFVGFENYIKLLSDKIFLISLLNVLKSLLTLPAYILIPLILAFFLNRKVFGWKVFRATYLFSYLLAPVMVGYMFSFLLGSNGAINTLLRMIGLESVAINWLGNVNSAIWVVFGVVLWSWFGLGTLIYLASMSTIQEELFDSAKLDGANTFHILLHITIPHVAPTIGYWGVLCTTGLLIWLFPFIYALTGGGPGYATMMPEYYIYLTSTKFVNPGYASALGIVLFIVLMILNIIQTKVSYSNK